MQMRVDGDDAIDGAGQQLADDLLADRLAVVKGRILPHVAEIGRHQNQPLAHRRAARPRRRTAARAACRWADRATHRRWSLAPPGHRHAQFAVRKAMHCDLVHRQHRAAPQAARHPPRRTAGIEVRRRSRLLSLAGRARPDDIAGIRLWRPRAPDRIATGRTHRCDRAARPFRRGRRSS